MIARRAIASAHVAMNTDPTESGPRCRSAMTIASRSGPSRPAVATMPHTSGPLTGHAAHDVGGLPRDGPIVEPRGQLPQGPALVDACGISLDTRDRVCETRGIRVVPRAVVVEQHLVGQHVGRGADPRREQMAARGQVHGELSRRPYPARGV